MNTHRLKPNPLTASAFAPFGDVIETAGHAPRSINQGTTQRYHDLARIDTGREAGRPLLNIFAALPPPPPLWIAMIERHPLGSQAFVPLDGAAFLIVVAAPGEDPKADDLLAFLARDGQGVNYAPGVWHHPVIALGRETRFLVIDRGGEGENCDIHRFAGGEKILLEM
ncbi:MAG: ureidoglycolate lyase [Alphaproteobacteria bacterium]